MSTPRRFCPRSIGTPRIPTGGRVPGVLSSKGHSTGAPGISGGLENALGGTARGVDPTEEHRGLLVGEEVTLGMQARGAYGGLEREPKVDYVYEGLQDRRGDTGSTW